MKYYVEESLSTSSFGVEAKTVLNCSLLSNWTR